MSNIIILSLISLGLVTSFSFIYSVKQEIKFVAYSEISGSENLEKRIIDVGEFHSIEASDQMKVIISQGPSQVEISAEDNLIELIRVKNNDGVLVIYREFSDEKNVRQHMPMIVRISNPSYQNLESFKQSEIIIEGNIKADQLSMTLRDQSQIKGSFEVSELNISITNQANANISGSCNELDLNLRDQSGIKSSKLKAMSINILQSSQSDAIVFAEKSIKGSVKDNASLTIKGNPEVNDVLVARNAELIKSRN